MPLRITAEHLAYIGRVYDAVLDPSSWPSILEELCRHMNARAANLLVSDRFLPEAQVTQANPYFDAAILDRYAREFAAYEVGAIQALAARPPLQWVPVEELFSVPMDTLPSAKWLEQEHGIRHRASARLNANRSWFDAITVNFGIERGNITAAERALGPVFLPHFARAVEIARPFQVLRARFKAVLSMLDRFHLGVFILGPLGHVVVTNDEARRILGLRDGITVDRDRLAASGRAADSLAVAITRAVATAQGEDSSSETVLTVERRSGQDPFLVDVSPLRGRDLGLEGRGFGAVVFVADPIHRAVISTHGMKELFKLTPAEAEVLTLLVGGCRTDEIAETRNASIHTVRTQIKAILSKTSTTARSGLVRLALSVNPPIDRPDDCDHPNER